MYQELPERLQEALKSSFAEFEASIRASTIYRNLRTLVSRKPAGHRGGYGPAARVTTILNSPVPGKAEDFLYFEGPRKAMFTYEIRKMTPAERLLVSDDGTATVEVETRRTV